MHILFTLFCEQMFVIKMHATEKKEKKNMKERNFDCKDELS